MTNSILENWFKNMKIVSGMKRPAIMLFDGHDTHLTYNTVQSALENSIIIICIPPSTSHALQLLDVSFFFSIKVKRKKIVLCFNHETRMEAVKKELFSTLIKTTGQQNYFPLGKWFQTTRTLITYRNAVSIEKCVTGLKEHAGSGNHSWQSLVVPILSLPWAQSTNSKW